MTKTNRIIMHIDMNSYFATVEQQANPLLRGKPVGVCAYTSANGCIIAASKEAKQYGVKTAMRIQDAKKLCPHIVLVENEPAKYRSISKKVFALFAEYTDRVEPYSIDEAFLHMTGWVHSYAEAIAVAYVIKKRIKVEIGDWLTCSIGISYTQWLAKFASEEHKPDGLTVLVRDNAEARIITAIDFFTLPTIFSLNTPKQSYKAVAQVYTQDKIFNQRPLQHACGIGSRMERKIRQLGIHTLDQLKNTNPQTLLIGLGKNGYYLWAHLNGIELPGFGKSITHNPKSIGHSYCVPNQGRDRAYLEQTLFVLCEKAGRRLREQKLTARYVQAGFRYRTFGGVWKRFACPGPISTTDAIWLVAKKVLDTSFIDDVVFLAVSVGGLCLPQNQLCLFSKNSKLESVSQALDSINDRYGERVLYYGRMHTVRGSAQDRIGFRKSVIGWDEAK